jgi:Glycosyl hydrolases family 43
MLRDGEAAGNMHQSGILTGDRCFALLRRASCQASDLSGIGRSGRVGMPPGCLTGLTGQRLGVKRRPHGEVAAELVHRSGPGQQDYVFNRASVGDAFSLRNGQNSYGQGQWASSLRYHDGTFYVVFNPNNLGGAYLYRTDDIENGSWTRTALGRGLHDPSLFFDDQYGGTPYIFYGAGSISAVRLSNDLTRIVAEYPNIFGASDYEGEPFVGGLFEGAQVYFIDGNYYIAIIAWPFGRGGRQGCSSVPRTCSVVTPPRTAAIGTSRGLCSTRTGSHRAASSRSRDRMAQPTGTGCSSATRSR